MVRLNIGVAKPKPSASMIEVRKAPFSLVVLPLLAVLLGILAFLQFRWIQQASDAEEQRARNSLRITLSRVKERLDSEIRSISELLIGAIPAGEHEVSDPGLRVARWRQTAAHPNLIRRLLLLREEDGGVAIADGETGAPIQLSPDSPLMVHAARRFEFSRLISARGIGATPFVREIALSGAGLIQPDRNRAQNASQSGTVIAAGMRLIPFEDGPVVVVETAPYMLREISAICLDRQYIRDRLLPHLIQEVSGGQGVNDFQFRLFLSEGDHKVVAGPARVSARQPEASVKLLTTGVVSGFVSSSGPAQGRPTSVAQPADIAGAAIAPFGGVRGGTHRADATGIGDGLWMLRAFAADAPLWSTFRQHNLLLGGLVLMVLFASSAILTIYADRLRALARTRSEIVMAISHELRTPITSIRVAADSMIKGIVDGPEQIKRYGSLIDVRSRDLERIAGDVVALARSERTVSKYRSVEIALDGLIRDTLDGARAMLERARLKPEVRIGEPPPVIVGDPDLLGQALRNLIENVCKYAASGERLVLECRTARDGLAEILVEDRGPGIPRRDLALIFEPFYRGEAIRDSKAGGIGLGLAIVKKIVENHRGSVKVSDAPGGGARFVVRVPAVKMEAL